MDYFPIFANLKNRPVLVVGGGTVAERKVRLLIKANAAITVIAPRLSSTMRMWAAQGKLDWQARPYLDDDLSPYRLVYAATDQTGVNRRVYTLGEAAGKLVNTVDQKELCGFISPAIVDRSPIMLAISSGGAAPVLARQLRTWLEQQLPQRLGRVAEFAASMRTRVKTAISDLTKRRIFWERTLSGTIREQLLAGKALQAQRTFDELLNAHQAQKLQSDSGHAALVGAGPGDAGLLTLRALQLMQQADVVLHDKLVSFAVLDLCRRDADLIDVGKRAGNHRMQQEQINQLLVTLTLQGKRVVRLKGGDPFIFGRGGEELLALAKAGIEAEVVPGISAAVAAAAAVRLPLTHRQVARSVTFVTAQCRKSMDCIDWASLAGTDRTLAIYMGVGQIRTVQKELIRHGHAPSTPWAVIENATRDNQRVLFGVLDELAHAVDSNKVIAPALLIVGEAAAIPQEINAWRQYHSEQRQYTVHVSATA